MATQSAIEWTDATWNPVTGCTKISPGCKNCYAEKMALRLQAMGQVRYGNGFRLTVHPSGLAEPLKWRKPRRVFVNSMSDLFHKDVSFEFIAQVFQVIKEASSHEFQILTKRSTRLRRIAHKLPWPTNLWMGVSVESAEYVNRISDLQTVPAAVKFLSIEPLLAPIPELPLDGIDWVIVGGESGPGARPMRVTWVRQIRSACRKHGVPFFFKQWGGVQKRRHGRELDGRSWDEMPGKIDDTIKAKACA